MGLLQFNPCLERQGLEHLLQLRLQLRVWEFQTPFFKNPESIR